MVAFGTLQPMLSKKLIDEYKQIIKEDYGVELSDQDAFECATGLVNYVELLMKIDQQTKTEKGEQKTKTAAAQKS